MLDTWFSSALFPLTALGWPHGGGGNDGNDGSDGDPVDVDPALRAYYPLSLMETGSDILFFWVARMAMMCHALTEPDGPSGHGGAPFGRAFLHPIVRDKEGRKMSKSLGNVVDPLHVIDGVALDALLEGVRAGNLAPREATRACAALEAEFPDGMRACGADALRFALAGYLEQGTCF